MQGKREKEDPPGRSSRNLTKVRLVTTLRNRPIAMKAKKEEKSAKSTKKIREKG